MRTRLFSSVSDASRDKEEVSHGYLPMTTDERDGALLSRDSTDHRFVAFEGDSIVRVLRSMMRRPPTLA